MKKLIKFILRDAYNILISIFLTYLTIYYCGKLDELGLVYTYVLVLLLGMIIGFGLYSKVSRLLYRMGNN